MMGAYQNGIRPFVFDNQYNFELSLNQPEPTEFKASRHKKEYLSKSKLLLDTGVKLLQKKKRKNHIRKNVVPLEKNFNRSFLIPTLSVPYPLPDQIFVQDQALVPPLVSHHLFLYPPSPCRVSSCPLCY